MICDHAAQEPSGKVYVNGAGVEWVGVPDPVDRLPLLFVVMRLSFPYRLTSDTHHVKVRVLDVDRQPVGLDPLLDGQVQLGRAPGSQPGDEFGVNLVFPVANYEIKAQVETNLYFHLSLDDHELAVLPLKLKRLVSVPGLTA
jgi:hypothetical protein